METGGGINYCWRPGGRTTVLNGDPARLESIFCPKNGCSFALFVNYSEISLRILQRSEYNIIMVFLTKMRVIFIIHAGERVINLKCG